MFPSMQFAPSNIHVMANEMRFYLVKVHIMQRPVYLVLEHGSFIRVQ
jgi:hypothetical protein